MGVWWHNETKMSKNWAFRSEIGYESPIIGDVDGYNDFPLFLPALSFEPRWYYNSRKRQGNSKNNFHNSSNYATIAIRFHPKFGAFSPNHIEKINGGVFITPTWGIRRNISYRLNYELGIGAGIDVPKLLIKKYTTNNANFNIHLRIGYKYGMKE